MKHLALTLALVFAFSTVALAFSRKPVTCTSWGCGGNAATTCSARIGVGYYDRYVPGKLSTQQIARLDACAKQEVAACMSKPACQ